MTYRIQWFKVKNHVPEVKNVGRYYSSCPTEIMILFSLPVNVSYLRHIENLSVRIIFLTIDTYSLTLNFRSPSTQIQVPHVFNFSYWYEFNILTNVDMKSVNMVCIQVWTVNFIYWLHKTQCYLLLPHSEFISSLRIHVSTLLFSICWPTFKW